MKLREAADIAAQEASEDMTKQDARKQEQKKGLSTPWRLAPVAAQTADGLITYRNLRSGGEEHNPVLRGLAEKSPEALLATKIALGIGSQALANMIHKKYGDRKGGKLLAKGIAAANTLGGAYGAVTSYKNRNGRSVSGRK